MKNYKKSRIALIVSMLLLFPLIASPAFANNERHKGPPPDAIKACEGKKVGDSITFTGRRGETVRATCREIQGKLAALPVGGPPVGPNRGPNNSSQGGPAGRQ